MMGIMLPETCRASNKICNKNHLLHLVGILFPHINDDERSKPRQINTTEFNILAINIIVYYSVYKHNNFYHKMTIIIFIISVYRLTMTIILIQHYRIAPIKYLLLDIQHASKNLTIVPKHYSCHFFEIY